MVAILWSRMRIIAALVSFLVLGSSVWYIDRYFSSLQVLAAYDPSYAALVLDHELTVLLVVSVIASFLFSLLLYLIFTIRIQARQMAFTMSRDISFSKEQFRRFYELSPVPYLLIDDARTIRRPNKASLRFLGLTEEEIIGKTLFSFLSLPERAEGIELLEERVSRKIAIEQKEVLVSRANGEVRWALLSIEDLSVPGSSEHASLVTLVDIHEQKELERIKTEFLSLASHQLRAPLANLKWYIDFLLTRRKDKIDADIEGYLRKMYRRNEDMIDLVNTLLNLSRIEMGRIKVERETVDVCTLAHGVVEELEPAAREKEIHITLEAPDALLYETDGKLVRIILQNLLSNAIRYTNTGGAVRLHIEKKGGTAHIEVEDTGIGIPPEEQAKVFSKLYRASNAQAMEVNGNGIGLYMCKALAEGLGGTITFTSTLGKGTTFAVELG